MKITVFQNFLQSLRLGASLELIGAYLLAIFWIFPLLYAFWAAFHAPQYAVHFELFAPLTLENFREVMSQAPFIRYALNTFLVVSFLLPLQLVISTLAAYAFAKFKFFGSNVAFVLVLVQLMITPEILIVQNYGTLASLGMVDTIAGIGLPYIASAFCIFLLRQTFKSIPKELEDAAQLEGCGTMGLLWKVYVPLAMPTYLAFSLVSLSHHWNNFLWPLIVTNSLETRPLTVGLGVFGAPESGVDWSLISAATLLSVAPLLIAFLLFQKQFVQSFMQAGIK
ncbi:MAG: ABC transporter permease subunit [Gammaproteobacteria bacterium]|nr:ABC transporter permease subunit [Gammaproteobacteria bacterium]